MRTQVHKGMYIHVRSCVGTQTQQTHLQNGPFFPHDCQELWCPSITQHGEQRGPSQDLEVFWSKAWKGWVCFCWLPREVVGGIQLQAFLCAVNWPSVGKTFFSDEEWSLSACQNWGNVLCLCISVSLCLSVCLLVCLSLSVSSTSGSFKPFSFLAITQGSGVLSSFSHGFD